MERAGRLGWHQLRLPLDGGGHGAQVRHRSIEGGRPPQTNGWVLWQYHNPETGRLYYIDELREKYLKQRARRQQASLARQGLSAPAQASQGGALPGVVRSRQWATPQTARRFESCRARHFFPLPLVTSRRRAFAANPGGALGDPHRSARRAWDEAAATLGYHGGTS